jgi:signal transduction histidine kinase
MNRFVERRLHLPARTIRLQLTALYGGLFLACGIGLLTITYVLVARQYSGNFFVVSGNTGATFSARVSVPAGEAGPVVGVAPDPKQIVAQAHAQSNAALHQLLIQSGIALAIMAVLAIWLGWLVAGRALAPLRTITNAAREISASNLHRRLALAGPDDELKQLGNTFDGLLERLEGAFAAQRQFVANASHELRTPLTYERALLEVALADPDATVESLRETCQRLLANGQQQERLIEALLTLSRSQRGLDRRESMDLAEIAREVVQGMTPNGVAVRTALGPAAANGDPRLAERLVANLVANAIEHNVPAGRVDVATETRDGRAVLRVSNTGPVVPEAELGRLFQPFQRLESERTGDGIGLGLSIVDAIATAHDADVAATPQDGGGLRVEVSFPATAPLPGT